MAINGKQKGKKGELELSHKLQEFGYNTRRSQQYCGANSDADVVGLPGVHIECKRTENLRLYDAMEQATNDCKGKSSPVVMHRKNRKGWVAIMWLEDFMDLYEKVK